MRDRPEPGWKRGLADYPQRALTPVERAIWGVVVARARREDRWPRWYEFTAAVREAQGTEYPHR